MVEGRNEMTIKEARRLVDEAVGEEIERLQEDQQECADELTKAWVIVRQLIMLAEQSARNEQRVNLKGGF